MAKIHEEIVVIKLSKLIKESDAATSVVSQDLVNALQDVAQELVGPGVVVEADRA
jgi:hypothetical protein